MNLEGDEVEAIAGWGQSVGVRWNRVATTNVGGEMAPQNNECSAKRLALSIKIKRTLLRYGTRMSVSWISIIDQKKRLDLDLSSEQKLQWRYFIQKKLTVYSK